jgi:general secretion pathway protein K
MEHYAKGTALITALFIMTLAVILATTISVQLQYQIKGAQISGVEVWAKNLLEQPNEVFQRSELKKTKWVKEDMLVTGELVDAQGFFNINNLQDPVNFASFIILLKSLDNKYDNEQLMELVASISLNFKNTKDSDDSDVENKETRDGRNLISASELYEIKTIPTILLDKAISYLIALPEITPININTASKPVLMSLGSGLSQGQADLIIRYREAQHGFKDYNQFIQIPEIAALNIPESKITTESNYFLLKATARLHEQTIHMTQLLKRINEHHHWYATTIWESHGAY